jgi:SET domain-containing protein
MTASAPGLEVRHSAIHGQGVFATQRFAAGEAIARYEGRRVSREESLAGLWDHRLTYLFALSDGTMIDGAEGGNATRHINHACTPNCVAYEIEDESGQLQVEIEALVDLAVGDELFLDYQLNVATGEASDYACRCASPACRGTMLGATVAPQPAA